jgi:hypothetical protein
VHSEGKSVEPATNASSPAANTPVGFNIAGEESQGHRQTSPLHPQTNHRLHGPAGYGGQAHKLKSPARLKPNLMWVVQLRFRGKTKQNPREETSNA